MGTSSLPVRRLRTPGLLPGRRSRLARARVRLPDGAQTTLHVVSYPRDAFVPRVVVLDRPAQLVKWCSDQNVRHAGSIAVESEPGHTVFRVRLPITQP